MENGRKKKKDREEKRVARRRFEQEESRSLTWTRSKRILMESPGKRERGELNKEAIDLQSPRGCWHKRGHAKGNMEGKRGGNGWNGKGVSEAP